MRRLTKILTVVLLVLSLGLHWTLLQTIAWTGMLVSYSRNTSLTEAVSKTFDGQHPCCMCKAIKAGREAEREQAPEKSAPDAKIKCVLPAAVTFLYMPITSELPQALSASTPASHQTEPQTPPPRATGAV